MTSKDERTDEELRQIAPKDTIEINGVRFSADEVQSVSIKRNGVTININTNNQSGGPIKGFART